MSDLQVKINALSTANSKLTDARKILGDIGQKYMPERVFKAIDDAEWVLDEAKRELEQEIKSLQVELEEEKV